MTENTNKIPAPWWFWIISIIALLWYLMDTSAFFMRVFMTDESLLAMTEGQRLHMQGIPSWVNFVFAFEVFGGLLGCLGLLFRKKWALTFFVASIVGVFAQTVYVYFLSDAIKLMGPMAVAMPLVAIFIGAGLIVFSKLAISKRWIN